MIHFISDFGFFCSSEFGKKLKELVELIKDNFSEEDDVLIFGGDNFYPNGILDPKDSMVTEFHKLFGDIKDNIFGVIGNHDYYGNINTQLQVLGFPGTNYVMENSRYSMIIIDTVILDPFSVTTKEEVFENICILNDIDTDSIKSTIVEEFLFEKAKNDILWLDKELKDITDKGHIPILVGHYPIYSHGSYSGKNNRTALFLIPLIYKYGISLYMCGHEHNTQLHVLDTTKLLDIFNNAFLYSDNHSAARKIKKFMKTVSPSFFKKDKKSVTFHNLISGSCVDSGRYERQEINDKKDIIIYENFDKQIYVMLDLDGDIEIKLIDVVKKNLILNYKIKLL